MGAKSVEQAVEIQSQYAKKAYDTYDTKQDLLETVVSYFEPGLHSNEFCLWAISHPITEVDATEALRLSIPDLERRLEAGQIELVTAREWYLKGGEFDLQRIIDVWHQKLSGNG